MEKKFREYLNEEGAYKTYIMKTPAGTYTFVGSVPVTSIYVKNDGSDLSDSELVKIAKSSNPWMQAKQLDAKLRSFKSSEEAKAFADERGIKVTKIKN